MDHSAHGKFPRKMWHREVYWTQEHLPIIDHAGHGDHNHGGGDHHLNNSSTRDGCCGGGGDPAGGDPAGGGDHSGHGGHGGHDMMMMVVGIPFRCPTYSAKPISNKNSVRLAVPLRLQRSDFVRPMEHWLDWRPNCVGACDRCGGRLLRGSQILSRAFVLENLQ